MANQMQAAVERIKDQPAVKSLAKWVEDPVIKNRFTELLGKNAPAFISALINIYNSSDQLQRCDSRSILGAAGLAATLKLSVTPSLGQAYIVPRGNKAVFQIGTKGFVQLAHRTGRYVALHAGKVYEGEIVGFNPVTGEPVQGEKLSDEVVGYIAYMKLINGFEKTFYMSVEEIESHAVKFSQSYSYDKRSGKKSSPWSTNFDAMASKTVLKKLLTTWGVLSSDMASAIQADQSVVDKNTFTYVDNGNGIQNRAEIYADDIQCDPETGEVIEVNADSEDTEVSKS